MASFSTAGGGSGSGSVNVGGSQVISPLAIPELLKLFNQAQSAVPTQLNSLQSMIQGGMNSPLLEAILGPALQRLQAPQAQQRQNLTEATRAAGGLRGSTYGQDMNQLQNNQALQSNDLMGQVIQQVLAQLVQGQLQEQRNSFMPAESLTNLLRAASPSVGRGGASASSGWDSIAPSGGLNTPMSPTPGFDLNSLLLNQPQTGGGAYTGYDLEMERTGGKGYGTPAPAATPYTPYLDPVGGGGWYDLNQGAGTQWLNETPQVSEGWW